MTHLLDARGYDVRLRAAPDCPVDIAYLGAVRTMHPALTYDDDPYVVSRVEGQTFSGSFAAAVKDPGIRTSGLRLRLSAPAGTEVSVTVCGQTLGAIKTGADATAEHVWDVSGLCAGERAYLEQVHKALYLLLAEMDRVCAKHGLRYYLVFGGLLGSVRYGEIIPWDDDVDVAMTRADLEVFKKVAPGELGADFRYLDCADLGGGAFLDFMCRVLYTKTEIPVNVFRKVSGKCRRELEHFLPLDIYVLDNASDDPRLHRLQMLAVRAVYGLGMGHRAYLRQEDYTGRGRRAWLYVRVLSAVGRLLPASAIFRLHDWVCTWHRNKDTRDYFLSNGYLPFIHTRYERAWFAGGSRVRLGDMEVAAPADTAAYLKRAYYDYFHYPPMDKRVPEHSPEQKGVI